MFGTRRRERAARPASPSRVARSPGAAVDYGPGPPLEAALTVHSWSVGATLLRAGEHEHEPTGAVPYDDGVVAMRCLQLLTPPLAVVALPATPLLGTVAAAAAPMLRATVAWDEGAAARLLDAKLLALRAMNGGGGGGGDDDDGPQTWDLRVAPALKVVDPASGAAADAVTAARRAPQRWQLLVRLEKAQRGAPPEWRVVAAFGAVASAWAPAEPPPPPPPPPPLVLPPPVARAS
jgi:hypothetical protein